MCRALCDVSSGDDFPFAPSQKEIISSKENYEEESEKLLLWDFEDCQLHDSLFYMCASQTNANLTQPTHRVVVKEFVFSVLSLFCLRVLISFLPLPYHSHSANALHVVQKNYTEEGVEKNTVLRWKFANEFALKNNFNTFSSRRSLPDSFHTEETQNKENSKNDIRENRQTKRETKESYLESVGVPLPCPAGYYTRYDNFTNRFWCESCPGAFTDESRISE